MVSDGGSASKTDNLMKSDFRIVAWAGWHLTSYATVVTLFDPLPSPIRFVDKSNSGNMIRCLLVSASFSCPSGLCLLLLLWIASSSVVFWSEMMSSGEDQHSWVPYILSFLRGVVKLDRCWCIWWSRY